MQTPGYIPDKVVITDERAAEVFSDKIKSLAVYRYAESYARVNIRMLFGRQCR